MNTKKLLSLVLALVLCVGTLAACSSEPATTTTAPAAQSTTAPAAQDTTVPAADTTEAAPLTNAERYPIDFDGTLTVGTGRDTANESHNWLLWEELTGVDVEWQTVSKEQAPLLFLSGNEMPDMFFQLSGLTIAQINEYGQGGLLINYMDYLDKMPNLAARYAEDPSMFDAVRDAEGNVYTLPYIVDTLTQPGNLFYVRTDMTTAAGWETLPTTVEDFLLMCEDLQNYYADVEGYVPMVCNGSGSIVYTGAYSQFFFPAFGDLMRADITTNADATKIEIGFATEQFKRYLTFMHTLYAEGYMDPECFTADSAIGKAKLIDGSTTMNPFATYLTKENFASGELDFQVMPALASSENGTEARWAFPDHNKQGTYLISSDCSDLDAALAFMDAAYSVEEDPLNDEGTAWGISLWLGEIGVDVEVNKEEGYYVVNLPEGYDSSSAWLHDAGSGSAPYLVWPYYENSGSGLMVKALGYRDILAADGVTIFYTNKLLLTQEEQDIYNDCWTDINTYVTEMNAAFITGQKDIEAEWDTYIATLNDMGLQDVIDCYQAALDRYNAG